MKTAAAGIYEIYRTRGMKSIGRPRPGYENLFNNSYERPQGAKTAGQFFTGYETFQAEFEECNFIVATVTIFVNNKILVI